MTFNGEDIEYVYDHIIYKYDVDDINDMINEEADLSSDANEYEIEISLQDAKDVIFDNVISEAMEELYMDLTDDDKDELKDLLCDEWGIDPI